MLLQTSNVMFYTGKGLCRVHLPQSREKKRVEISGWSGGVRQPYIESACTLTTSKVSSELLNDDTY